MGMPRILEASSSETGNCPGGLPLRPTASLLEMATESYPVATVIATGDIERLRRNIQLGAAVVGGTEGVASHFLGLTGTVKDALGGAAVASQLAGVTEPATAALGGSSLAASKRVAELALGIGGSAERARGIAASVAPLTTFQQLRFPSVLEGFTLSEEMRPGLEAARAMLGISQDLQRAVGAASAMLGQFKASDWLQPTGLIQGQASSIAAATNAAETFVHRQVLPEIPVPEEGDDPALLEHAADWWAELPRAQRHALRGQVGGALVAAASVIVAATQENMPWMLFSLLSYWLILYEVYALVDGERERRAGDS
ncbi:MAG: hypothetical protein ACRDMU_02850 [Gaiellaceae bacterium]